MKTLIVYESMYGNTHVIASSIARGLQASGDVELVPVDEATAERVNEADFLVVGGPTHAHGMTSEASRDSARRAAHKPGSDLALDSDATGPGLRDWFKTLAPAHGQRVAAFDTRMTGPKALTGHASRGIIHRLRKHGFHVVVEPESFLVTKTNTLVDGEADRATRWGETLTHHLVATT